MSSIKFENVSVEFPIFNANGRSLTSRLLQAATGGALDADPSGRVVVKALEGINLQINPGERVGLLGHNGSGKSTLLRALGRIYSPTNGSATIEGRISSLIDISLGINPEATGKENVFVRASLLGLSKREIAEKFDEIVEFSELGDFIEMPVRTYSSGMHLRLAFAVSTLVNPEILLMDEWLSVGDESFRAKAEGRLLSLIDSSEILVIASHSQNLLAQVCTRGIWLEHGKIKLDAPIDEVIGEYFP